MQANKITIGGEYAVRSNNAEGYRGFRVEEITQRKTRSGTATHVAGVFSDNPAIDPETGVRFREPHTFAVADLLGAVEEYAELVAARKAKEAAYADEQAQRKALVARAANVLALATSLPVVEGYRERGIRIDGHDLKIPESVLPELIAALQKGTE